MTSYERKTCCNNPDFSQDSYRIFNCFFLKKTYSTENKKKY